MDDRISTVIAFLETHSLDLKDVKISHGHYIIHLSINDPYINLNDIFTNFNELSYKLGYNDRTIDLIQDTEDPAEDYIEVQLPVLFTKDILDKLSIYDWNMELVDRSISPTKYLEYINSITDSKLRSVVGLIIENTTYINFATFKYNLESLTGMLPPKFNILLSAEKIGSEHWALLLIWNKIKDNVIKIINNYEDIDNDYPIVYIDDAIYSAINSIGIISFLVSEYNEHKYTGGENLEYIEERGTSSIVNKILNNEIIILCPYVSKEGIIYLTRFMRNTNIKLKIIASTITQSAMNIVKIGLQNTIYNFQKYEDIVDYFVDVLGVKDTNIPIYFDHKIAGEWSSFPSIYTKIVKELPSRYKIEELEELLTKY